MALVIIKSFAVELESGLFLKWFSGLPVLKIQPQLLIDFLQWL
jgi:hypothetical protein